MADKLRITLVKSTIGAVPKNKKTVEALKVTPPPKSFYLWGRFGKKWFFINLVFFPRGI